MLKKSFFPVNTSTFMSNPEAPNSDKKVSIPEADRNEGQQPSSMRERLAQHVFSELLPRPLHQHLLGDDPDRHQRLLAEALQDIQRTADSTAEPDSWKKLARIERAGVEIPEQILQQLIKRALEDHGVYQHSTELSIWGRQLLTLKSLEDRHLAHWYREVSKRRNVFPAHTTEKLAHLLADLVEHPSLGAQTLQELARLQQEWRKQGFPDSDRFARWSQECLKFCVGWPTDREAPFNARTVQSLPEHKRQDEEIREGLRNCSVVSVLTSLLRDQAGDEDACFRQLVRLDPGRASHILSEKYYDQSIRRHLLATLEPADLGPLLNAEDKAVREAGFRTIATLREQGDHQNVSSPAR